MNRRRNNKKKNINIFSSIFVLYFICFKEYTDKFSLYAGEGDSFPKITQDSSIDTGYIANIQDTATIGFKYFSCKDIKKIKIWTRGYIKGVFEVRLAWDGRCLARIPARFQIYGKKTRQILQYLMVYGLYTLHSGEKAKEA